MQRATSVNELTVVITATAVQHAHAVDATARPQDRGVFEGWNQPEVPTDLSVAAQLMGNPFGCAWLN
jgi:hypothetical protein